MLNAVVTIPQRQYTRFTVNDPTSAVIIWLYMWSWNVWSQSVFVSQPQIKFFQNICIKIKNSYTFLLGYSLYNFLLYLHLQIGSGSGRQTPTRRSLRKPNEEEENVHSSLQPWIPSSTSPLAPTWPSSATHWQPTPTYQVEQHSHNLAWHHITRLRWQVRH